MNPEEHLESGSNVGSGPGEAMPKAGLLTLVFTDLVGSTALKERLGDRAGVALVQEHHGVVRKLLGGFPGAQEISTAGDSFLLVFSKPSDGVRFALLLLSALAEFNRGREVCVQDRVGLHVGEVLIEEREGRHDVHGMQVDTCARVMSLAQAGQILMTRPDFCPFGMAVCQGLCKNALSRVSAVG